MRKTKNKVGCLIILFIIFSYSFQIYYLNPITTSNELNNQEKIHNSASVSHSKQWITNPHFISSENWTSTKGGLGDPEDVEAYISGGHANYDVLGKNNTFSLGETPVNGSKWTAVPNPDFPYGPTSNFSDSEGLKVYHLFDDHDANQNPSVHWDRNFTMPVDMSDYVITSASLQVKVNATVSLDVDVEGDTRATEGGAQLNQQESYDYVRFYALISDLPKNKKYELAYIQPNDLGQGNPWPTPGNDTLSNTYLIPYLEDDLIYFITSVLSTDNSNFTLTLGIRIYTADNSDTYDNDLFHELLIKSVDFNFTYQRKINQLTSISWNQEGEKPNDVSSNTVVVTEALLDFKYMINDTWTISSPNSEIRILINDFKHTETVKLSTATTSLQKAKIEGFDVTYLIEEDQNINISIQVYIADEFTLNRSIRISVDDIYLNVTYNEIFADISTNLYLFLENENKTANPVIDIPLGENLNITVKYIDSQTKLHITNATVQLEGKVIGSLNESLTLQQYSIIVNTSDLGIGVKILTVTAQKDIYQTQPIQFFVEVTERETVLELYLDSFQKFDGDTVQLEINETLNVTVKYKDFQTTTHLSNATVDLVGVSKFNETNNQYNVTIDAKDLGQGITAFTIFAQLLNYQPQSIQFFVDVIERETDLILFIDGSPKNDGDTIQVEIDDFINVTVYYRDNETKEFLPDASINLVGRGELDETINYYNITINAADLDQGITVLTIFAQLVNYQHQSIQFFVEVIERATKIQLYLNDEEKTLDPVFNLSIGQSLNITVKYQDNQTENHIDTATLQLIGEGLIINLTRNDILGYHYIILEATELGIGVKLFSIVAQATNFQILKIDPRITVTRINALISLESGESQIETEAGEEILMQIMLNDTLFGGLILNATVTYRWAYGQGNLEDLDNNGIYEVTLENVPAGVYSITITAFAGDDYDFNTKDITLIVTQPETERGPDLSWLIYVLIGAIVGLSTVFALYQTHFKYPPMVRKVRKLRKKIRKGKKMKPIIALKRKEIIENSFKDQSSIINVESNLDTNQIKNIEKEE